MDWSFLGLDLGAIVVGLTCLALDRRKPTTSTGPMVISVTATGTAGLMTLN